MPDWLSVITLGIVEGITEFLPISSTGHLLLTQLLFSRWLPMQSDLFNVVIQSGAVLAVLPLFPDRLKQVCFSWQERQTQDFILKVGLAFFITGVGGFFLEENGFTLPDTAGPIVGALLVGGILFLLVERSVGSQPTSSEITWKIAILVGIGQLVAAVFPGASRSGTTILMALVLGLSRPAATEFSFLVGVPTMLAAGGYKILKELADKANGGAQEDWGLLALGFLVSAVVSFAVVKWLLAYVQTHTFVVFGWYRIGLSLVMLLFMAF
ncbi:MAG: Undecaprenyl-diphosphatase [Verrucomicrobia subdivision 3 bacterium]|nr:Undecaprenyl-diphosphatase [Limisphaerales bacterium]MCS1414535.1 Undecaprenyl-diphosphatase [Limisphaerales bacterium]